MEIAILGAGNGGVAAAADLALQGHSIRLFQVPEFAASFSPIRETRELILHEGGEARSARLAVTTHDVGEAVYGAEAVLVIVPAFAQEAMADQCGKHLGDDQLVFLLPGGFGSYIFRRELERQGARPVLGETATLPYGARMRGEREVDIHIRTIFNPFAACPASQNERAAVVLGRLYPDIKPVANVLDVALNNTNPCVHPVPVVLSASRIEYAGEDFWLYREAMTPAVWRVMRKVDAERIEVRKALGLGEPHCRLPQEVGRVFAEQFGYDGIQAGHKMKGPDRLDHRYLTEDVPMGLVFFSALGDLAGVETPATDAVIELAGQLLGRDFWAEGRSLAALGLESHSPSELRKELQ